MEPSSSLCFLSSRYSPERQTNFYQSKRKCCLEGVAEAQWLVHLPVFKEVEARHLVKSYIICFVAVMQYNFYMAQISKYLLTDGFAIPDPRDIYYDKDFSKVAVKGNVGFYDTPDDVYITVEVRLNVNTSKNTFEDLRLSIVKAGLEIFKGNQAKTARALGISVRTIYNYINKPNT